MGSGAGAFFKSVADPFQNPLKSGMFNPTNAILAASGPNSSVDKWVAKLPGATSGFTKTVSPETYAAAETADNLNKPPAGYVAAPTPGAGQAPSLAGANAAYSNAAAQAATRAVANPNTANGPSTNFWNTAALAPNNTTAASQTLARGANAANAYSGQTPTGY